jgi:hypothetical protein
MARGSRQIGHDRASDVSGAASRGGSRRRAIFLLVGTLLSGAVLSILEAHGAADPSPRPAASSSPRAPNAQGRIPESPRIMDGGLLTPNPGWPVWIKDYARGARTHDTSGMAFVGRDQAGRVCFFLADDVGELHFCRVSQPGDTGRVALTLQRVGMTPGFVDALKSNQKWDFEALSLDRARHPYPDPERLAASPPAGLPDTVHAVLSIEGHGSDSDEQTRVIRIRFSRKPAAPGAGRQEKEDLPWQVFYEGEAIPGARFWQGSVQADRGFKGLAFGEFYLHLGLDSIDPRGEFNVHGSLLFSYDRVANQVTTQSTLGWGVRSIAGMEALSDSVTLVLDRDRQAVNVLRWDPANAGWIRSVHPFALDLPAPDGFRYAIPSPEGLAVDDRGDLWCVIDPWAGHYRAVGAAPESLHVYLEAEIPIMYRFAGKDLWKACGLDHLWPAAR